jgi:hypothetical protein
LSGSREYQSAHGALDEIDATFVDDAANFYGDDSEPGPTLDPGATGRERRTVLRWTNGGLASFGCLQELTKGIAVQGQ